jgi:protein-L-isoaspartate(D-aspartate) O-methyltransferase
MPSAESLLEIVKREGITNSRLLQALETTDRADFVPKGTKPAEAYRDEPIRIGQGQTTSQPSLIARMIDALALKPDDSVLEIGTGLGYQTALLARVCSRVVSIERYERLATLARRNLEAVGIENALVLVEDGTKGAPEHAPFNGVIGSAAAPRIPEPIAKQLAPEGRVIMPLGPGGQERVQLYQKQGDVLQFITTVAYASFVPMFGEYGW